MRVVRRTYKDYAGIVVYDKEQPVVAEDFDVNLHMHRATFLAAALEGPYWGTVQSYDGAGMSAGVFHWIGRYRNGSQGPLFKLLRRIELEGDSVEPLWSMFRDEGWYVASDGRLRSLKTGHVITGNAFRNVVAPPHGKVPVRGPDRKRAEEWARQFHSLFANRNRQAQVGFAVDYLVRGQQSVEIEAYRRELGHDIETPEPLPSDELDEAFDLAMCVYHSHSVNAPGPAVSCLRRALKAKDPRFSRVLVRALATKKYGAWDKRYARTRRAAMRSGLWPREMFVGPGSIMPASF